MTEIRGQKAEDRREWKEGERVRGREGKNRSSEVKKMRS
jgi:hypothetical protein